MNSKMILVTHGIISSALTHRSFSYPSIFFVALISHYVFDMIPHWHYNTPYLKKVVNAPFGERTLRAGSIPRWEVARVLVDLAAGFLLSFYFFGGLSLIVAVAVFGAVLPDLMVGLGRLYPIPALVAHDRFHRWIHAPLRLDDRPLIGIGSQVALSAIFVLLFR
jgi:hypothetical protein